MSKFCFQKWNLRHFRFKCLAKTKTEKIENFGLYLDLFIDSELENDNGRMESVEI